MKNSHHKRTAYCYPRYSINKELNAQKAGNRMPPQKDTVPFNLDFHPHMYAVNIIQNDILIIFPNQIRRY